MKTVVRTTQKNDSQTGSWCSDKAVLVQGVGGNAMQNYETVQSYVKI